MKKAVKIMLMLMITISCTPTEPPENEAPVIRGVYAFPEEITINDETTLSCIAEDPDEDNIMVSWSSQTGSFPNGNTGSTVLWKAPGTAGEYYIRVYVEDLSHHHDIDSVKVKVTTITPVEMILVPGGTYQMGDTRNEGESNEKPVHSVSLSSFYIGKYEVTQKLWYRVMGTSPSGFRVDGVNLPVEQVSWYGAINFCNALSDEEGLERYYTVSLTTVTTNPGKKGYRLPTEAEWEYAAKEGLTGSDSPSKYSGSDNIEEVAWYSGNSGGRTHNVGTKAANELGIYDMSGNVFEWCWDRYGEYSSSPQTNPQGPASGSDRVLRGGSWYNIDNFDGCRSTLRPWIYPAFTHNAVGFRLARDL
ncbi:MAG: formylglycine-generating enzyme family protein [Ignavibacteriales bacterium]|nr:formylglycine-generating enzyme family protein [Ignavibacteriales bacterium]MCF8314994.1 formylglycine-generating enzyme family protein [Ignavibacteriales bacterium]MCF8436056.1 formylglycine-generating enzyme family protein [Ignavibacteriales bacterium]